MSCGRRRLLGRYPEGVVLNSKNMNSELSRVYVPASRVGKVLCELRELHEAFA